MDLRTKYSTGFVVTSKTLQASIYVFEICWLLGSRGLDNIHNDGAFHHDEFKNMLGIYVLKLPCQHHKKSIEPKQRVISSKFLPLQNTNANLGDHLAAFRTIIVTFMKRMRCRYLSSCVVLQNLFYRKSISRELIPNCYRQS